MYNTKISRINHLDICNITSIFQFSIDSYDETINVRGFSGYAMFGSIGGYVGMILGISFLQLPGLISSGIEFVDYWMKGRNDKSKM